MRIEKKIPLIFGVPQEGFIDRLKARQAFVAELRPGLEGATLVAKGLLKKGRQPILICDNMMAFCMERGLVSAVYIFYQALHKKRALCRTGSLIAALCAKVHGIPVYLSPAKALKFKASSLLKIGERKITVGTLKTYVPFFEEVPLELIKES
jgi:methylthioribose-1-phosphate isomerase